jgi:hypothetical protein
MKKTLFILAISLAAILLMAGCSSFGFIRGSGNVVTKEFGFQDFTRIEVANAFHFEITRADSFSVVVSTDDNLVSRLDLSQTGKNLTIKLKPASYSNAQTKAVITLPALEGLEISGATQGTVSGFQSASDFDLIASGASRLEMDMESGKTTIQVSGASQVTGQIKAQDMEIEASGASRCELSGTAGKTRYEISGASQAITGSLLLQSADVEVSGASKAVISTNGTLDIDVTGASRLEYYGSPVLGKVNVNGASTLTKK